MSMKIQCVSCPRLIDIDREQSYTIINNVTLEKDVICEPCFNKTLVRDNVERLLENSAKKMRGGK